MKILFFDLQMPDLLNNKGRTTGGACVRINYLASGLQLQGCDVGILTWKGYKKQMDIHPPYELIETFPPNRGIRFLRKIYYNLFGIFREVKKFNPDVLVANGNSMDAGFMAFSSKVLNIPLAYLVTNNVDVDSRSEKSMGIVQKILFRFTLMSSDLMLCQNRYQLDSLKGKYAKPEYLLLPNPYDVSQIQSDPLPLSERKYIAWVGIFSRQKNLTGLLDIVQCLPEFNFKIAGSPPTSSTSTIKHLDPDTTKAIEELKQCDNVEFVGFVKRNEIWSFLSQAYVLLNTSHFEGFSNTFLEAFAAGTPVVTRSDIDPDHIIKQNHLGSIVDNYSDVPGVIESLINSPEYDIMAQSCQSYLKENHDQLKLTKRLKNKLAHLKG